MFTITVWGNPETYDNLFDAATRWADLKYAMRPEAFDAYVRVYESGEPLDMGATMDNMARLLDVTPAHPWSEPLSY